MDPYRPNLCNVMNEAFAKAHNAQDLTKQQLERDMKAIAILSNYMPLALRNVERKRVAQRKSDRSQEETVAVIQKDMIELTMDQFIRAREDTKKVTDILSTVPASDALQRLKKLSDKGKKDVPDK